MHDGQLLVVHLALRDCQTCRRVVWVSQELSLVVTAICPLNSGEIRERHDRVREAEHDSVRGLRDWRVERRMARRDDGETTMA